MRFPHLKKLLGEQLRASLGPARDEAHDRLAEHHRPVLALEVEELREYAGLLLGLVGFELELAQPKLVALADQVREPVARRMQLEPVADARRDERPAAAVLLHPQVAAT